MKRAIVPAVLFLVALGVLSFSGSANAAVTLGVGNSSLLGGDLTDPEDDIVGKESCAGDLSEEELKPQKCNWVRMKCFPANSPPAPPHQRHPYQSWQNSPACAIFLNKPENRKWYVGFKDGGYGGPVEVEPYYCAVELEGAFTLTHFTITTSPDMPNRDPKSWAVQGSNTGKDDDWTDIYRCDAKDRSGSPFREQPRGMTTLFASFTSDNMGAAVAPKDLKNLQAKLGLGKLEKADFSRPAKAYTWFRVVVYSCFNPNSMEVPNPAQPAGFALGQLELFGVPGVKEKVSSKAPKASEEPVKPPVYDAPFIISYWCGPPKAETTLERYKEIAECGFNVAFPAIDSLWEPGGKANQEHNRKYLDICRQAGLKALVWDGTMPKGHNWSKPTAEEIPQIEKTLDGMIARYAPHPALLGYVLADECDVPAHERLGVVTRYLLKKDPKHLPYYNLLPNYAGPLGSNWRGRAYERSVAHYIKTVRPALVSWDHYRQMFQGGDERFYWENLEIIRRQSLKARIPYNQIIVSMKHMGYRECSEADLRWQVYTSLAYGSRGIQYFTYWYVKGLAWAEAPALITKDGRRDVKWHYVKKINNRIAKLGPTLAKVTSTGVYCTDPLPPGTRKLGADAPVKKAEGGAMVIGCFKDAQGREYIMPVNRSFHNKITAKLTMDEKTVSVSEISQGTGELVKAQTLVGSVLEVPLEAGEGRMFLLHQKP